MSLLKRCCPWLFPGIDNMSHPGPTPALPEASRWLARFKCCKECWPLTALENQICTHFAHIGHSIVGDKLQLKRDNAVADGLQNRVSTFCLNHAAHTHAADGGNSFLSEVSVSTADRFSATGPSVLLLLKAADLLSSSDCCMCWRRDKKWRSLSRLDRLEQKPQRARWRRPKKALPQASCRKSPALRAGQAKAPEPELT